MARRSSMKCLRRTVAAFLGMPGAGQVVRVGEGTFTPIEE
jgi:hypothetical protein